MKDEEWSCTGFGHSDLPMAKKSIDISDHSQADDSLHFCAASTPPQMASASVITQTEIDHPFIRAALRVAIVIAGVCTLLAFFAILKSKFDTPKNKEANSTNPPAETSNDTKWWWFRICGHSYFGVTERCAGGAL